MPITDSRHAGTITSQHGSGWMPWPASHYSAYSLQLRPMSTGTIPLSSSGRAESILSGTHRQIQTTQFAGIEPTSLMTLISRSMGKQPQEPEVFRVNPTKLEFGHMHVTDVTAAAVD